MLIKSSTLLWFDSFKNANQAKSIIPDEKSSSGFDIEFF
jgi:hypothetical protein